MSNNLDERYYVVEEAIFDAFFGLLHEKSIEKITVSDVIRKAGVVRSTFYNHYENIPSLVAAMEDKTIEDIFTLMENFHPKGDREICKAYFMTLCDYTMKNPFLSELLQTARGDSMFEKMVKMLHKYVSEMTEQNFYTKHTKEEVSCAITCAIGAAIAVLHKWSKDGYVTPKETIAEILTETFIKGILPQMS